MKRLGFLVPVGILAALLVWAFARAKPVTVTAAQRGPAVEAVYATGTVEADPRVVMKAKVSGTLVELLVKEGDRVKVGQLLCRIDNQSLRYDLQRTRAEVRASAQRNGAASPQLAALKAARDSISADVKLAGAELQRAEGLVQKGAMALDELDRRRERVNKLKAEWAAADARLGSTEIDLRVERERLGAMEGSVLAQNADAEMRAPLEGTIISRKAELGEAVAVGQPLLTVGNTNHLLLEVKIDEADVGRVRVGQEVLVDLYAFANRVIKGTVDELFPDADRDTKTFLAKVELRDKPDGLRSGMSAEVNIVVDRHDNALLIPAGAVAAGKVQVVDGGRVQVRPVCTGLHDTRNVEIVSGLELGERVVVVGPKLEDGARVTATDGLPPEPPRQSGSAMSLR